MSLERKVYSCAELQVFSCYRGWKEACQATRAISTTWRSEVSLRFFFPTKKRAEGMLIKIQPDATVCRYLFTAKSLYVFRVSHHPSSGVLKQGRRKFTQFWQKHYVNIHHRMPASKTGWPTWNAVILPPLLRSTWTTKNSIHPADYWSNSWPNLGIPPDFG